MRISKSIVFFVRKIEKFSAWKSVAGNSLQITWKIREKIFGYGLAGAVLAHTLIGKNIDVLVLDKSLPHKASNVAGGIINPFIGPKLNIPEDFADCILHDQQLEFLSRIKILKSNYIAGKIFS